MSFFRILNGTEPDKAKIKDTDFEQFYPSINTNMAWKSLEPYAYQAEQCYIVPWISEAYYQELSLVYNKLPIAQVIQLCTPTNSQAFVEEIPVADLVFYYLRAASAYYTVYHSMPHINTSIGDAGIFEKTPDNTTPVRQWTFNTTRWDALIKGYEFLDKAIMLMESEIDVDINAFKKYRNSTAYSVSKDLLIPSATTLSEHVNIKGSRRAYISMRPYIRKSEALYLRAILGTGFFTEIKAEHKAGTLTAANALLLPYIQAYLAECTVYEATPEINIYNQGDGWKVLETTDGMNMSKDAQANMIQNIITKSKANQDFYLAELEGFLYKNIDDYPTFKADTTANEDHEENIDPYADEFPKSGAAFF